MLIVQQISMLVTIEKLPCLRLNVKTIAINQDRRYDYDTLYYGNFISFSVLCNRKVKYI